MPRASCGEPRTCQLPALRNEMEPAFKPSLTTASLLNSTPTAGGSRTCHRGRKRFDSLFRWRSKVRAPCNARHVAKAARLVAFERGGKARLSARPPIGRERLASRAQERAACDLSHRWQGLHHVGRY